MSAVEPKSHGEALSDWVADVPISFAVAFLLSAGLVAPYLGAWNLVDVYFLGLVAVTVWVVFSVYRGTRKIGQLVRKHKEDVERYRTEFFAETAPELSLLRPAAPLPTDNLLRSAGGAGGSPDTLLLPDSGERDTQS